MSDGSGVALGAGEAINNVVGGATGIGTAVGVGSSQSETDPGRKAEVSAENRVAVTVDK